MWVSVQNAVPGDAFAKVHFTVNCLGRFWTQVIVVETSSSSFDLEVIFVMERRQLGVSRCVIGLDKLVGSFDTNENEAMSNRREAVKDLDNHDEFARQLSFVFDEFDNWDENLYCVEDCAEAVVDERPLQVSEICLKIYKLEHRWKLELQV